MAKSRQYSAHAFLYNNKIFIHIDLFMFQRRKSVIWGLNKTIECLFQCHILPKKEKERKEKKRQRKNEEIFHMHKYSLHARLLNLHRGKTVVLTRTQLLNNQPEPMIY